MTTALCNKVECVACSCDGQYCTIDSLSPGFLKGYLEPDSCVKIKNKVAKLDIVEGQGEKPQEEKQPVCRAEEFTSTLLSIISEVERLYNYNYDGIGVKDRETQDLLHEMELAKFNACQGYKLTKKMAEVRKARRIMTDENETMRILYECLKKHDKLKQELISVHKQIKSRIQAQSRRDYTPRVRTDLTITDKQPPNLEDLLVKYRRDVQERKKKKLGSGRCLV